MEDEAVASFWQLQFMQQASAADVHYYDVCAPFLPPDSYGKLPACQAQEMIYQTYCEEAKDALPPPCTRENIQTVLETGKIDFASHTFHIKKPCLSSRRLFQTGGNWLQLTPPELKKLIAHPFFTELETIRAQREKDRQRACQKINYF